MNISFCIDIDPHGKGRPRATSIGGKARQFTPAKTRNWEATFALLAQKHRPAEVIDGPIAVTVTAFFARPKRLCKRSKRTGALLGGVSPHPIPMTSRPDADNVAKSVLDAMASWWRDDALVYDLRVLKFYHALGERPGVEVTVST